MPAVPLGIAAYSRQSAAQPETRLVNMYMEEDKSGASPDEFMRLQRPGLTRFASLTQGPVRGLYQSDNSISNIPIVVAGPKWFRLDGADIVAIADLPDDGATVRIEATFERVGVISAGEFHVWNGETTTKVQLRDTLTADDATLTLRDLPPIIDLDVLNGYFILGTSGGTFYWLVPGENSVQELNYATAEALPDGLIAIRRLRDDVFMFGANSIEVWQATGDANATFSRATGRLVDRGIIGRDSLAIYDNSLLWVGDDSIVYRMGDGIPDRISDFGIEERLKNRTDEPSAWVFTSYGHKFYVLRIPGQGTFAYYADTKLWCEFSTLGATEWRPRLGIDTATGALCGDATGALFKLDPDSSLDDGQPFERLVSGTIALPSTPVPNSSIAIGVGTNIPAVFRLRWNDPRRGWSEPRELMARGEGDILNAWRMGMARAPSRTFEISTVSPAHIRISGAVANEGWRV
ncbi:phage stabilization protein [Sphingomonas faeni]|uniref:Phage stabilization protein n=1 Tax=Sphingomonas faeni TaxID=185950 RepID=A0A2T5U2A8_9SPHN|nr:packaged DNA stabilization protein [Sphingomonas faeni]PTW45590.1 phage stabilization protein [Sphingomonas faeni]